MNRRGKSISCCALLAAIAVAGSTHRAEAALGIVVTDTVLMPIADPKTQMAISLSLVAMNELSPANLTTMTPADNFTIYNVPGYSGVSSYNFVFSSFFTITATPSGAGLVNLQLAFTPPTNQSFQNATVSDLPIGQFIIQTNFDYSPTGYAPLLVPFTYTSQTHLLPSGALSTGTGTLVAHALVPEPSSVILTAIGLGAPCCLYRRRGSPGRARDLGGPPSDC